jgi:hypothetical protein
MDYSILQVDHFEFQIFDSVIYLLQNAGVNIVRLGLGGDRGLLLSRSGRI